MCSTEEGGGKQIKRGVGDKTFRRQTVYAYVCSTHDKTYTILRCCQRNETLPTQIQNGDMQYFCGVLANIPGRTENGKHDNATTDGQNEALKQLAQRSTSQILARNAQVQFTRERHHRVDEWNG